MIISDSITVILIYYYHGCLQSNYDRRFQSNVVGSKWSTEEELIIELTLIIVIEHQCITIIIACK